MTFSVTANDLVSREYLDVVLTDIRMPPSFTDEGIEAAKHIRKLQPGTGVVILSQYDDPAYAVSLLAEGSAGYAYLLKDRIAEGDQLARAIREVATGGSMLDPVIVSALINPVRRTGGLSTDDDELLEMIASGRTIKSIAGTLNTTPSAVADRVEGMRREHRLARALTGSDVPHPRYLAGSDDPGILGMPFFLMEAIDGWSPVLAASRRKRGAAETQGKAEEAATPAGEGRPVGRCESAGSCESDDRRDLDGLAKEEERATDPAVRVAIGSQSL